MRQESGFTLIEVLIAMLLMSFIFICVSGFPAIGKQIRVNYETKTIMETYLEGKMEEELDKAITNYATYSGISKNTGSPDVILGRSITYDAVAVGKTVNSDLSLSSFSGKNPPAMEVTVTVYATYGGKDFQFSDKFLCCEINASASGN